MKKILILAITLQYFSAFGQVFDFYGPKPFGEILDNSFNKSWTPTEISAIENRKYIALLDAATKSQVISLSASDLSVATLSSIDQVHGAGSTYGSMLHSIFQIIDIATHEENDPDGGSGTYQPLTGKYKLVPFLHSYFAINSADNADLNVTDAGSYFVADQSSNGYLLIEFSGSPSATRISATSQWVWNNANAAFEEVTDWPTKWLQIDGSNVAWTETENDATLIFLADTHDLIDLKLEDGSDFNPASITYQTNATAEIPEDVTDIESSSIITKLPNDLSDEHVAQLGTSAEATLKAIAMLDNIETTLQQSNASLRYPKDFYLSLRENMLSHKIASTDIYGGKIGFNTVAHVYFTNASDDSGVPHPFMVVSSHAVSTRPNTLLDVNRPPGSRQDVGYSETPVTRHGKLGEFLVKIPLKDYGLIENLLDNDLSNIGGDLATDFDDKHTGSNTAKDVYNYAGLASIGIAVDGVTIYPAFNNNLRFAVEDAEVTQSGIHVGGGLELHYHADGHAFNGNGINLYNLADYAGHDHPPVIGMSQDGIALFGKYEGIYSSMVGFDVVLDEYGGHDHGDTFGYHYHAHTQNQESSNQTGTFFDEHFLLVGAWKGQINDIPGFLEVKINQLVNTDIARYAGAQYDSSQPVLGTKSQQSPSLGIYPNPNKGSFKLENVNITELEVLSLDGKLLKSIKRNENSNTFSLNGIPEGIYIIKWANQDKTLSETVIIK
ncbi:MAG: T9SS type A sorting domain-containing protein [Cyclobacteriaceae bacterium]